MVKFMADRRRIFALGVAGVVLTLELMQPSGLITVPLLLASLFLIAWAVVPDVVRHWATKTGPVAPYLLGGLDRLDSLLAHIVGGPHQSKECLDRLADKITEGSQLLNRQVKNIEERDAWLNDYRTWTDEVFSEIEDNFGRPQAVIFRTIGVPNAGEIQPYFDELLNAKKLRLKVRLDNLKSFVNANFQKAA